MADGRIDRERNRSLGMALDLRNLARPGDGARQLVQVYDGGTLPTAGDKVYLTHPAVLTFDDTEGAAWSGAIDSSVTLPVVVLGSRAPAAGDYLVAHLAGGRWVAESRGGGVTDCNAFPCHLPFANLTASWVFGVSSHNGSGTMVWNGSTSAALWTICFPDFLQYKATLGCGNAGAAVAFKIEGRAGANCTGLVNFTCTYNTSLTLNAYTCSPLHLDFIPNPVTCSDLPGALLHFYIDYP